MRETNNSQDNQTKLINDIYQEIHLCAKQLINKEFQEVTFQATELVNETYLKLFNANNIDWKDHKQFVSAAVVVMRRFLVDHARKKNAAKRIPKQIMKSLDELQIEPQQFDQHIVKLDDALTELGAYDERQAKIVEMKFFAGFTENEIAELLNVSRNTVSREWKSAKMWLKWQINENG